MLIISPTFYLWQKRIVDLSFNQTGYFPVGFVQFVESVAVAEVLNQHTGIQSFFKICAPCENTPYGFQPEVMDNFVKSCGKGDYSDFYVYIVIIKIRGITLTSTCIKSFIKIKLFAHFRDRFLKKITCRKLLICIFV